MKRLASRRYPLRGVYGELAGNEHVLQWHLPVLELHGGLRAALRPGWSEEDATSLIPVAEADRWPGTADRPLRAFTAARGDVVALVGPRLWPELRGFLRDHTRWRETWTTGDGRFRALPMSAERFEEVVDSIAVETMRVSRKDLANAVGKMTREGARALAVLLGVPIRRTKERFYRIAAAKIVAKEGDSYLRTLRLAAVEFGESFEDLDAQVKAWMRVIRGESEAVTRGWVRVPPPVEPEGMFETSGPADGTLADPMPALTATGFVHRLAGLQGPPPAHAPLNPPTVIPSRPGRSLH